MSRPIAIIGSGYSAATIILHLNAVGIDAGDITVIGPGALGAGQAYGTIADEFRLNVRADLMRLWADDPTHFERWAAAHIDDPNADSPAGRFYRRRDFARYMSDQLAAISNRDALEHVAQMVTRVEHHGDCWRMALSGGGMHEAAIVILASGNPDPKWPIPNAPQAEQGGGLITVPWRGEWLDDIGKDDHVAVIGSGLTAMDALHSLAHRKHRGPITVMAPHGMLPPVQTPWEPVTGYKWPRPAKGRHLRASQFLRAMRDHVGDGSWHDTKWQERFEELRVHISAAWQMMPPNDRQKLTRRLGWLWSLARFRAGPQSVASVARMLGSGQLSLEKGRLIALEKSADGWGLLWRNGHVDAPMITVDVVVNCTGMGRDTLLAQMIEDGLIGVQQGNKPNVGADYRVQNAGGETYDNLFMIGPATAPALGDVIGSASIARQAGKVAESIKTLV